MKKNIVKRLIHSSDEKNEQKPKKGAILLTKTILAVPLFLFALWLIKLVYFPQAEAHRAEELVSAHRDEGIFQQILSDTGEVPREHFHIVDELLTQPEPYHPLCANCHGTYPHSKEKKVRSILNSHNGFMACMVCHVRKNPEDENFSYIWVDRLTGETSVSVDGGFGRYPAKIYPMRRSASGHYEIIHPVNRRAAEEFLRLKDQFTPDQMAKAKIKLHENISKKPVFCNECHKKDGYFDFAKLGFPENRVDHLTSTEITGMIDKYETFYMPEAIDFGSQ